MAGADYFHCCNPNHDADSDGDSSKVFYDSEIDWHEQRDGIKVVALCPRCAKKIEIVGRTRATRDIVELYDPLEHLEIEHDEDE